MADLNELYQSVILDHNRKPRNFRSIIAARIKIEFFFGLGENKRRKGQTKNDGDQKTSNFHLKFNSEMLYW